MTGPAPRLPRVRAGAHVLSRLFLLAVVGLLAPAGCGVAGKDQASVLHRRLEGEPKTLNGILATTDPELTVLALLSRNLLDYDERLALVPGLAESVEADAAHLVYTVRLREARWEDGSPVTAEDVVFTLRSVADPKVPAVNRRALFEGFASAEAVDPRTARVVFTSPSAGRLHAFALPLLSSAQFREARGEAMASSPLNRRPLANGPFRLGRWEPGRTIELVRNTHYFGEKVPAEKVVFRVVPDSSVAFEGLRTGALDETRLTFSQLEALRKEDAAGSKATALLYPELSYTYVGWNNRLPLFSDPRVRRALTMLVDREGIARTLYGGTAAPANGPVPPGLPGFDPGLAPWPFDPGAAARLLDEAGFAKGKDGVRQKGSLRLAFALSLGAGSDLHRQIAETLQESFRSAGIAVDLRPAEWASFVARVDAGDFEACSLAMNLDPNPDLYGLWHSSQAAPNGWNVVGYASPRADALMDDIRREFDPVRAASLSRELARVIHEDEPVTFLHNVRVKWGVSRRVEDVRSSPYGLFLFWPGGSRWRPVRASSPG